MSGQRPSPPPLPPALQLSPKRLPIDVAFRRDHPAKLVRPVMHHALRHAAHFASRGDRIFEACEPVLNGRLKKVASLSVPGCGNCGPHGEPIFSQQAALFKRILQKRSYLAITNAKAVGLLAGSRYDSLTVIYTTMERA